MVTKTIHNMFNDVFKITSDVYPDNRGTFEESFNEIIKHELPNTFRVWQENISVSKSDVARGLHWQISPYRQAKLVHCAKGTIIDIFVDIRKGSKTLFKPGYFVLNQGESVFIPHGYAHGFIAIEESVVVYKVDNPYAPEYARSMDLRRIIKLMPDLSKYYGENLIMSDKDLNANGIPAEEDLL